MMKVRVTHKGSPLEVGDILECDEIPVWLVNKCVIINEPSFEVATPKQRAKRNENKISD